MIELIAGPWGPLIVFGLRVVDVSLATMRVLLMVRATPWIAPVIGFFEILIWIVAIGGAIQNLSSPLYVVGYAGGYAGGTALGIWIERKLALGLTIVLTFTRGQAGELASALRADGFGVTELEGRGREGPIGVLYTVVRRRRTRQVLDTVDRVDPDAFVTIEQDANVRRGWIQRARHL